MNNKSTLEQREQDRTYLKLPMSKRTYQKNNQTQKLFAFSKYFIYIVLSTAFFTNLCSFLPDNLISICVILHILDIVITSTIIILANDYTLRLQHKYKSQYQNKPTYWHYFIYVVVYKYVSIVNNNTKHLYTSPPYSSNPLYKAPFQHLLYSLLFYSSYSYSTGCTNLTTNKYVLIVISVIFSQFFSFANFDNVSLRELFQLVLYVIFSFLYRFSWIDQDNHDLGVLKQIFPRQIKYKFQKQQQTNKNVFNMLINKIFNHRLLKSQKSSKKQFHRIIWATLSITYFIFSTTKQVWQYWHWMILWNIGIQISKSKQLNVKIIQKRYTNILWAFSIIYLGQNLYFLLFYQDQKSECNKVGNLLNFHLSNLICLMISGLYIMLQQDSVEFKQNHLIEGIYSIAMIQSSNYMNHSHLSKDKPYNLSVLFIKHILLVLIIMESIILYQIYSYKYHYHATKITNFHEQPHLAFYNYTGDDNYSIYQNANFGYVLILVCFICSWCLYKMIPLYGIQFSHETANSSESIRAGFGYSQSYRKMLTRTLITTFFLCCVYSIFKLNKTTDRYTKIIKQLIFLLPKCDKIQQFYKISSTLQGCQSMDYPTTSVISVLSVLILLYWCLVQKTKYWNKSRKQYLYLLTECLFYLSSVTLATLCLVGILNWQCFSLNNWILIYVFSILLSIVSLINYSQSCLKYKQF